MERLARRLARRRDGESGFVIAWFALILVVLLAFAGLAIDVSNWWATANKIQRAADAAALGGVVYLPAEFGTARTVAEQVAGANGYDAGNSTVTVSPGDEPNQLRVSIRHDVRNFFASVLGFETQSIERSAVAEFDEALEMGSPENFLGDMPADPEIERPFYWLNMAGSGANKTNGDRYAALNCSASIWQCVSNLNEEWEEQGYFYTVDVNAAAVLDPRPLSIQVFDPGFVDQGDTCTDATFPNESQRADLATQGFPDADARYESGPTQYCTGDNNVGGGGMVTTYLVRAPDASPWDPEDNPIIGACTTQYPNASWNQTSGTNIFNRLNGRVADLSNGLSFPGAFRQWVELCSISTKVEGQYFVQVKSTAPAGDPAGTSSREGGHNRFSMRAGLGTSTQPATKPEEAGVRLYARGRLPIYTNVENTAGGTQTEFFLTRVLPSPNADRVLSLQFWDIGDTQNGTVNFELLKPTEWGGTLSCSWARSSGTNTLQTTWGGQPSVSGCTISGAQASNSNGRLYVVSITIPRTYTCNEGEVEGCWFKVRMTYSSGAQANDTTTWGASVSGDPVRLIE